MDLKQEFIVMFSFGLHFKSFDVLTCLHGQDITKKYSLLDGTSALCLVEAATVLIL